MTEQIHSEEMPIVIHEKVWPQFHILPHVNLTLTKYLSDVNAMPLLIVNDDSLNKLFVAVRPVVSEEAPPVLFTAIGPDGGAALLPYTGNLMVHDRVASPTKETRLPGFRINENVAVAEPGLERIDMTKISRAARMVGYRPEMLHMLGGRKESFGSGYITLTYELGIDSEYVLEQLQLIVDGPEDSDVKLFLTPAQLRGDTILEDRWQLDRLDYIRNWQRHIIHNEMLSTDKFGGVWWAMWRTIETPHVLPGDDDYYYHLVSRYSVPGLDNGTIDYTTAEFLQCWYNFMHFVKFRHRLVEAPRVRISDAEHHRMVRHAITSGQMGPIHFRERPLPRGEGKVFVEIKTGAASVNFEFIMAKHDEDDDDSNLPMGLSTLWGGVLHRGECEFDQYALEGILAVTKDATRAQLDGYVRPENRVIVTFEAPEA